MKKNILLALALLLILAYQQKILAQNIVVKDSIVYRTIYRDTIIHRYSYDTIRIKHYVHTDTLWAPSSPASVEIPSPKKRGKLNPTSWGIGPSVGAYYSPYNGFDMNIGFGVQYYLFAIPSFRNPHLGHKRKN